jgi:hypothetical protein
MSDIVKVLRGKYALDYDEKTLDQFCNEAADEIEKLRAERRAMQGALLAIKAHTQGAHPMSYMDQLYRMARAALGEKE